MAKDYLTKEELLAQISALPEGSVIVGVNHCADEGTWTFAPIPDEYDEKIYCISYTNYPLRDYDYKTLQNAVKTLNQ